MMHAAEAAEKAMDQMQERAAMDTDLIGHSWGLDGMDKLTGGICSPDLSTIAAGTGEGKTTFALNTAQRLAMEGVPTVYFSLEMDPTQLIYKSFAGEIDKPINYIQKGKITDEEQELLIKFLSVLKTKNLFFNSKSGISVIDMRSIIRGLVKKQGVKVVFIDYVQLMQADPSFKGTRERELAEISRQLKECCRELDISIYMLSQVTIEKNAKRLYTNADLRESKAIGHDSDNIYFIFRPLLHGMAELKINGMPKVFHRKDALVLNTKFRRGQTGIVEVDFNGISQTFTDKVEKIPFPHNNQFPTPEKNNFRPLEKSEKETLDALNDTTDEHGNELPF